MITRHLSLSVSRYLNGDYCVAVIQRTYRRGELLNVDNLEMKWCTPDELPRTVERSVAWIVAELETRAALHSADR